MLFIIALIAKSLRVSKGSDGGSGCSGNDKLAIGDGKGHDDSSPHSYDGIAMEDEETMSLKHDTNVKRRFRFRTRRRKEKPQVNANIV